MSKTHDTKKVIKVGISTCLLGQKVRFDGGHKRDRYVTDILGDYFRFVPVCPELEVGMGVPRESVRLYGDADAPLMIGNKTEADWTKRMNRYSEGRVRQPDLRRLSGYILKKDSPSCGMERVRVYNESGMVERKGVGLYARALLERYPHLPVEEEGRLNDAGLRENFIVRVFAYHRLQELERSTYSRNKYIEFHTAHKYLFLAHSPKHYKELGQLMAAIKQYPAAEFKQMYREQVMAALKVKSTTKKNTNVLHHILGFLKDRLTSEEKKDIVGVIEDYHSQLVPLVVPITLLRHYINKYDVAYIKNQVYLNPHPKELMLRNHV